MSARKTSAVETQLRRQVRTLEQIITGLTATMENTAKTLGVFRDAAWMQAPEFEGPRIVASCEVNHINRMIEMYTAQAKEAGNQ